MTAGSALSPRTYSPSLPSGSSGHAEAKQMARQVLLAKSADQHPSSGASCERTTVLQISKRGRIARTGQAARQRNLSGSVCAPAGVTLKGKGPPLRDFSMPEERLELPTRGL